MSNGVAQSARFNFCHPLLHARDWQHRPQLDDLCRWWTDGGAGVCALIGIGGAGKTAIADRFLHVLPEVMPRRPDLPKRTDLTPPQRLFVFSFYDARVPADVVSQAHFDRWWKEERRTHPRFLNLSIAT